MFFLSIPFLAASKYMAIECSSLNTYLKYLQKSEKGVLEKHPNCNAAAIKKAYSSETYKEKWISEIEAPYQSYFGHPSSIFRDCETCASSIPFYKIPSKDKRKAKKYVLVLSIDGGGVKGLIPARILQYIEKKTGKKISEIFDVFVGTSTGGLIALFLNTPTEEGGAAYDGSDLVKMYRELPLIIFSNPNPLRKLRSIKGIITSKYSAKPYEQLLKKYFKNIGMAQSLNPVLVTSVDIETQTPFEFRTFSAVRGDQENFFMWEAARATSAAPVYFKPYKLRTEEGTFTLVDGGVGINNPSLLGISLAKRLYPKAKILFVSLSTQVSEVKNKFKTSGPLGGGALSLTRGGTNITAILHNLLQVPARNAEQLAERLLTTEGSTYIRIATEENEARPISLDDSSQASLDKLEKISDRMIKRNPQLKKLIKILLIYIQQKELEKVS